MLPAAQHVRAVYENDVAPNAKAGSLMIDCSTIDVGSAREVGEKLTNQGFDFVDAPVSGGIAAAAGGSLTFMVGGSEAQFARARPFLEPMAKAVIHAGQLGAGQAAKICNNMILGATMAVTCEAFVLAQKLGLEPQVFFDISSKASGQSWSMTTLQVTTEALLCDPASGTLYAGTSSEGVFASVDSGATWRSMNAGLTSLQCLCLDLDTTNQILYVGTYGGGIWRMPLNILKLEAGAHWLRYE
jgi:6-phosphogluconate dehydrogenase (decarboxylating)